MISNEYSLSLTNVKTMIPPILRYIIVLLLIVYSVLVHYNGSFGAAIYTYIAAAMVLLTTLVTGTVFSAFKQINAGAFDAAEKTLAKTYFPNLLLKKNKANYYFMKGVIELNKKNYLEGDQHLKRSLEIGLKTPTNQALVYLNLAHSSFLKGDFLQCKKYIETGKSLDANLHVIKKLEELEAALPGMVN